MLPQRERAAFGNRDQQAVRIKLEHGGIRNPRVRYQPAARAFGIEEQQRRPAGHAGKGQRLLAADLVSAAHRDCGNAKAERICGLVAGNFQRIADRGHMAADDSAVGHRRGKQQQRRRDAGALRNLCQSGG